MVSRDPNPGLSANGLPAIFYVRKLAQLELYRILAMVFICLSASLSVTTRYCFKTRWDRDFGFSPHDSLESLVFRDKISCRWVKGVPPNEGAKRSTPLKRRYSAAIGSSNVKMVADRHRHAADHNKHWRRAS